MKKVLYIILPLFILALLLIYFTVHIGRGKKRHYDFILHFEDAKKNNFSEDYINQLLAPIPPFVFNHSTLIKNLDKLFLKNSKSTPEEHSISKFSERNIKNGVYKITFANEKKEYNHYFFKFKERGTGDYWAVFFDLIYDTCYCRVMRVYNGKQEVIEDFKYPLPGNESRTFFISFFADYLVLLDKNIIWYQQKDERLNVPGRISFLMKEESGSASVDSICKFAEIDHNTVQVLLDSVYSKHTKMKEHKFCFEKEIWNPLYTQSSIYIEGKKSPYLHRVKLGSQTMPAIILQVNAALEYKLEVPDDSSLEFSLAVISVSGSDYNKLQFVIDIKAESGDSKKREVIDIGALRTPFRSFHPVKIDLKDFGGKKCLVKFSLAAREQRVFKKRYEGAVALASPMIYSKRDKNDLNVILISLDSLRSDHLGCYGYFKGTSPRIDKLAAPGVVFKNVVSCANWTLPSHMSILTGLYPMEAGFSMESKRHEHSIISPDITTIAEYLRKNGYKTIGLHGAGWMSEYFGFDKGFEKYTKGQDDLGNTVETALDLLSSEKDKKFFLFLHTYTIHSPYRCSFSFERTGREFLTGEEKTIACYDSGIRYADEQLGRLFDWLSDNSLLDKTIIIITSDHGESFRNVCPDCKEGSHSQTLYDDEIKVPLILAGYHLTQKSKKISGLVSSMDILPTVLNLLEIEPESSLRGVSLLPLVENDAVPKPRLVYTEASNTSPKKFSVRSDRYKLIACSESFKNSCRGIFKKIYFYDIIADVNEMNNIYTENNKIALQHKEYLTSLLKQFPYRKAKREGEDNPFFSVYNLLGKELKTLGYTKN